MQMDDQTLKAIEEALAHPEGCTRSRVSPEGEVYLLERSSPTALRRWHRA